MPKLIITREGVAVGEHVLPEGRTAIGRRPRNDIQLDDQTVSGEHAAIIIGETAAITDLDSTNGTFVNGERVGKQPLTHGDRIRIGQHELRFFDEQAADYARTVVLAAGDKARRPARLTVVSGPRAGSSMPLGQERVTLGKAGSAVAVVAPQGGGYRLLPMAEVATILLNGEPVAASGAALNEGDEITLGKSRLRFEREA